MLAAPDQSFNSQIMKSINFEFLRAARPELADLGGFSEQYAFTDPSSCLGKLRTYAESLVKAVFAHYQLQLSYQSNLNDLLNDSSFKAITPNVVLEKLHLLRIKGNHAVHGTLHPLPVQKVLGLIKEAYDLGCWLHLSVDGGRKQDLPPWRAFTAEAVDVTSPLKRENRAVLQRLAEQEALMAKVLADLEEARAQAEATKKSKEEKEILLKQAQQTANALDFSEEETRFKLIDEHLVEVGWQVGPRGTSTSQVGQEVEVLYQPNASGEGYADYVLWDENGKPLAVVEAKKTAKDAEQGKMQARYYADGLEKMYDQRPVIFYTNGYEIFIWDDVKGEPPRALFGFYSRDSLQYCLFQTRQRLPHLAALNPKAAIVDRMYQIEAVKRVAENFDKRRRKALIIQATGTGKTRVAIALCELMIRAGWAKRILFLCDRKELRKQAGDVFDDHLASEPRVIVTRATAYDRQKRIYLATYPAMMKCFQNFDVGFFDLIIADESHRSIYNRYRDLFRYFDAFQVGLTATPVKFVFRNIGRGTRLGPNLFGRGKDKQFFQIFDHWGNFEYFDELQKEEEPSRFAGLTEQLFEARIRLGEASIQKQDLPALKLSTHLLAADIAALPQDCICVREKWREIRVIQRVGVLDSFRADTVATLRREITPLMQWRDVRGAEPAYQFDLLIAKLQEARLTRSAGAADLRDTLINQVSELPINLTQVAEKLELIQKKSPAARWGCWNFAGRLLLSKRAPMSKCRLLHPPRRAGPHPRLRANRLCNG
jgi:hypothetical protein